MNEEDTPELVEAVRRLPEEEQNLRMFRIKRALDLSMKHQLLPKEEWTKPEEVTLQTCEPLFETHLVSPGWQLEILTPIALLCCFKVCAHVRGLVLECFLIKNT